MPVLDNGIRAWLETPTTLKVPEFVPSTEGNKATSYIVARPGEPFSLRYDHVPLQDYDLAWKLCIKDANDGASVEQWGGPPLEMRKSKGIVKVRAMRISEDGTRFREFAWAQKGNDAPPIRGTITLSLHLCHFAEATAEVAPSTTSTIATNAQDTSNMTGDNGLHNDSKSHPVLAPPTTRPQGSKLWTWYWRDDEPRAVFQFTYATKEALQAEGIIPLTNNLAVQATPPMAVAKSSNFTHKPRMSHGSLSAFSPRDLIKRKQSISLVVARQRGYSSSSTESSTSSFSDGGSSNEESDGASASSISSSPQSVDLDSDSDIDEGHAAGGMEDADTALKKARAINGGMQCE